MPKEEWVDVFTPSSNPDEVIIMLDKETAHRLALHLPTSGPMALLRAHLDARLIGLPGAVRYVAERPAAADARTARRRHYAEIMMEDIK